MSKGEAGEDFGVAQTGKRADLLATFFGGGGKKGNKGRKIHFPVVSAHMALGTSPRLRP